MNWESQSGQYHLAQPPFAWKADGEQLKRGLELSRDDRPLLEAFSIPDPDFVEQSQHAYSRGSDLFTLFENQSRTAECYWRLVSSTAPWLLLESIVSLRSSKLTTERIEFALAVRNLSDSFRKVENVDGLFDQATNVVWYLTAHPDDAQQVSFELNHEGARIDITVPWLERGVIRRIRILLAVRDGLAESEELAAVRQRFAESEIPLTT